jgi:hypothetical protein
VKTERIIQGRRTGAEELALVRHWLATEPGWLHVGATTGRSRNDTDQTLKVPIKDLYVLPLTPDFRRRLCA